MDFIEERREVARFMRRIYQLRLTSATGGNISRRAGSDAFAITPSGVDKASIRACEVGLIDLEGRNLTPELKPSCEWLMHLRTYQRYPSVGAIVHAHPVTISAFSCAETPIEIDLLSETYAICDPPVMAPYALMGTGELAEIVAEYAGRSSSVLLENHAVLTTGSTLMQAFSRLEVLEEAAKLTLITRQLEGVRRLTPKQRADLDRAMGRGG